MEGRTTLLVAHRRSTLRLADRIVVVDHGAVLDQGTHEELLGRSARYRELLAGAGDSAEAELASRGRGGDPGGVAPVRGHRPGVAPSPLPAPGGGGGGGGGWIGALAATPELLAKVEALPPADDEPDVDWRKQAAWDPHFSLRRFLRPFRRPLALGLVLVIIDALATLAGPVLIRSGIDGGVARGSITAVWVASGVFLAVTAAD